MKYLYIFFLTLISVVAFSQEVTIEMQEDSTFVAIVSDLDEDNLGLIERVRLADTSAVQDFLRIANNRIDESRTKNHFQAKIIEQEARVYRKLHKDFNEDTYNAHIRKMYAEKITGSYRVFRQGVKTFWNVDERLDYIEEETEETGRIRIVSEKIIETDYMNESLTFYQNEDGKYISEDADGKRVVLKKIKNRVKPDIKK